MAKISELTISKIDDDIFLAVHPSKRNYKVSDFLKELLTLTAKQHGLKVDEIIIKYTDNKILLCKANSLEYKILDAWNILTNNGN